MAEQIETVNQEENAVFTQEDVDRIVGDRLSRERAKYADYDALKEKAARWDAAEEANKTELQKAQESRDALQKELDGLKQAAALREMRDKVAEETGVPASLLTGATEEDCKAQADAIKAFAKPGYPDVRDGGEAQRPRSKKTAKDAFAEWWNQT